MLWWTVWQLRSTHLETRRQAIKKLGAYPHSKVLKHFVAMLSDGSPDIRRLAAEGVSRIAWSLKKHVQWVQPGMVLPKWDDQGSLGATVVDPLLTVLQDDDHAVREQAVEALGAVGDPRAVDALIPLLDDSNHEVRRQVADTLAVLGDSRAMGPLVRGLNDKDGGVRLKAAEALERLDWEPRDNRQRALRAVALSNWEEAIALGSVAVEPLAFAFRHSGWMTRYPVIEGLMAIGDDGAVDVLVEALRDSDPAIRRRAAKALIRIGRGAVNALLVALESHDWEMRRQAAEVLGIIGDTRTVPPLVAALGDQNIGVRWHAMEALGKMGPEAVKPLVSALGRSDKGIRWWAAAAVEKVGECAVEPLIGALREKSWELRQHAAEVLGTLGGRHVVEPLAVALGDDNSGVRGRAAVALQKLGWVAPSDHQRVLYTTALAAWNELHSVGRVTDEPSCSDVGDHNEGSPGPAMDRVGTLVDPQSVS